METLVGRLKVFGCYLASPETVCYPIGPIRSKVRGLEGTVFLYQITLADILSYFHETLFNNNRHYIHLGNTKTMVIEDKRLIRRY